MDMKTSWPMYCIMEPRVTKDKIRFEITKDNYETFCNAVGLYKKDFIETLKKSEADHKAGRVTKRKSLSAE